MRHKFFWMSLCLIVISSLISGPLRTSQVFLPDYEGKLYPKHMRVLSGQVQRFMEHARKSPSVDAPEVLLVPAGEYVHVGGLLADAYSQVENGKYESIVILAPSMNPDVNGVNIFPGKYFRSLLGVLQANDNMVQTLLEQEPEIFKLSTTGFNKNYFIEVQLPFILELFGNIDILPLAVGRLDSAGISRAINALSLLTEDRKVLYIISANPDEFNELPKETTQQLYRDIMHLDSRMFLEVPHRGPARRSHTSGLYLFGIGIELAKNLGASSAEVYRINNDIDISGNPDQIKTYLAGGFYGFDDSEERFEPGLTAAQIRYLLYYGHYIVHKKLEDNPVAPYVPQNLLDRNLGVHVSIVKDGKQIGSGAELFSHRPVGELLESTINYALFSDPVTGSIDINQIRGANLKLTFVGRAKRIFTNEPVPEHGLIYLKNGSSSSMTFCRMGRSAGDRILRDLCLRAGLLYNCYDDDMTEVYHFNAISGTIVLEFK